MWGSLVASACSASERPQFSNTLGVEKSFKIHLRWHWTLFDLKMTLPSHPEPIRKVLGFAGDKARGSKDSPSRPALDQ